MKTALTIAGSDSSGGAGIQADIKTMTANGVYAMSVITALTAQNTTGVFGISEVDSTFVEKQLVCVFEDIYPDAVKIGMLSSGEIMKTVAAGLKKYNAKHVVLDPVMVATSGSKLMKDDTVDIMVNELFPLAEVVTPNIPEAMVLSGINIESANDMETAAKLIYDKTGAKVLLKGGHSVNDANDLLYDGNTFNWIQGERVDNPNTHGTGCTLSSAIASNLAKGYDLITSVKNAKAYITGALKAGLDLGKGSGPLMHGYTLLGE